MRFKSNRNESKAEAIGDVCLYQSCSILHRFSRRPRCVWSGSLYAGGGGKKRRTVWDLYLEYVIESVRVQL